MFLYLSKTIQNFPIPIQNERIHFAKNLRIAGGREMDLYLP